VNLYKLTRLTTWTTIAICLITTTFQAVYITFMPGWWWLAAAPIIFVPAGVNYVGHRRAWKQAELRKVLAVISRPITTEEADRLRRKGLQVDRMFVTGTRSGPTPPDAALRFYQDLVACLDTPVEVEQLASETTNVVRRSSTFVGTADELADYLTNQAHDGHRGERR
jgi:hypothetical protein